MRGVVGLLAALMLTGCTGVVSGEPPGAESARSQGEVASTYTAVLAPPVTDPRDVRGIAACDLMTPEQERRIELDLASEDQIREGDDRGCGWETPDGEGVISTIGVQDPPVGLDGLYNVRETYPVFEPGEIDGRPIVRANFVDTDGRDCTIFIGVADDQMIQASAKFAFQPGRGCEVARAMAEAMVANLPPAR